MPLRILLIVLLSFSAASLVAAEAAPLRAALLPWESTPPRPDVQRVAADLVALAQVQLSAEPDLTWVERAELDKLLAEADLAASGRLDPRASLCVGKLARAQLLVTGHLDAADHEKTSISLDVIDLERGDLLVSSSTPLPARPHKHFVLRDEERSAAVSALRALLAKAVSRQRELSAKPAFALLFLSNSGPSSRLDSAGERLADALRESASLAGARVLRFPRVRDSENENDLAVLGLAEADDQAWRGVADLYAWGDYKEIPADGISFENTIVEASLTLWDGASSPRTIPWRGTIATFGEARTAFTAALHPALRKTSATDPAARSTAAKLLAVQASALERNYSSSFKSRDFWTSELGRNFQLHRVSLLQASAFLRPDDGAVRRALFNAKWDSRAHARPLSTEARWNLYADRRIVTERYPDTRGGDISQTYQRSQRISDLKSILAQIGNDLRLEKRLRVSEARRAASLWVKEARDLEKWTASRPEASREFENIRRELGDYLIGLGNGPYYPSDLGLGIRREMLDGVWPLIAPAHRAWIESHPEFGLESAKSYIDVYAAYGEEEPAYQRVLASLSTSLSPKAVAAGPSASPKPARPADTADRPPVQPSWSSPPSPPAPAALGPDLQLRPLTLYRWLEVPSFRSESSNRLGRVGELNGQLLPPGTIRLLGHDGHRLWIDGMLEPEAVVSKPPARRIALLSPETRELTEIGARLPGDSRFAAAAFARNEAWLATNFSGLLRINSIQNDVAQITPDAGLPSLKIGALALYDGGLAVAAAAPETGLARFDSTTSRWLNLTLPNETTPAPAPAPRQSGAPNAAEPTRLAGLGPWILVGRSGVHLFDTRTGAWSEELAAHRAGQSQRRAEWIRQSAQNRSLVAKASDRGDLVEVKRLTASLVIPREWTSETPAAILADESAFWIGGYRGLVRYDPKQPVAEARSFDGPAVLALADAGRWLWVLLAPEDEADTSSSRGFQGQSSSTVSPPHSLGYGHTEPPEWRRSRIALFDKREFRWRGSTEIVGGITSLAAAPGRLWAAGSTFVEFNTIDVAPPEAEKNAAPPATDIVGAWLGLPPSPLHAAVEAGDLALLKRLLADGRLPVAVGAEAWTPLHLAANRGNREAVEILLAAGADVRAFTRDGRNALGFAAARGDLALVRRLLAAGADPRAQARLHLHGAYGFDAPAGPNPVRPPAQPSSSSATLLPDGRAKIDWSIDANAGHDGFAIYRFDKPQDPSQIGDMHFRFGLSRPGQQNIGRFVFMLGSAARSWIDPHPVQPGGAATYTVVAVNRFDRAGPLSPPAFSSVARPAKNTEGLEPRTWETHPLDRDRTPLLLAAEGGHAEMVEVLLAAGADPDARDAGGRTALHLAVVRGHSAVADRLITAGVPLDAVASGEAGLPERLFVERIHPGELGGAGAHTALSLVYLAHRDQALFRRLLAAGANPVISPKGALAALAASRGREEDLEALLKAGPHPFVTDIYGHTAFTAALEAGRLQLAGRLRERLFAPSHPAWPAGNQLILDAYYTAVRKSDLETIKWLRARGASLATADGSFGNPLELAVEQQANAPIIRELLAAGANPRFVSAEKIAKTLDPEVRALLAGHKTTDTPQTDATNRIPFPLAQNPWFQPHGPVPENRFSDPKSHQTSPPLRDRLHRAAATGDQDGIRTALAEGAWIDATDAKGWTALIHALNGKQQDAARLLIDHGASLNRVTDFGSSPLCFAASIGSPDFVDELIDLGADPNLYESKSGSPLTIALERDLAVARRLLSREADPRLLIEIAGDIHHVPALFIFAGRGNLPAVQTLVAGGVDPKTVLRRGKWAQKPSHLVNALPFAASSNDLPTLNYFLSLGLDPTQENAFGDNALDWALARKADRTAAHLRTLGVKTRSERGLPDHDD